jgi:RimJ/RimL family protein N-acetyltransferase
LPRSIAMNIETKRLLMRAIEPEDAQFLADMLNDPEVRNALGAYTLVYPTSKELEERWIAESAKKTGEFHVLITSRKGGRPIGMIGVRELNERNGSGHLSIMIERKGWDKGYGTEAITGMLEYLFLRMNMHRIWLRVDENNPRAISCYKNCGFKVEGKLREDHFARGGWQSSLIMSVLAGELRGRAR